MTSKTSKTGKTSKGPKEWSGVPGERGDPLERYYTPELLARHHVLHLDMRRKKPPLVVIDTGLGSGAYGRAVRRVWPKALRVGIDLDPRAAFQFYNRYTLGDVPAALEWLAPRLSKKQKKRVQVIGNPAFLVSPSWIEAAREAGLDVSYLMPAGLATRSKKTSWPKVFERFGATQTVIDKRPWKTSRECAVYDFDAFAPKVGSFTPVERISPPAGCKNWGNALLLRTRR